MKKKLLILVLAVLLALSMFILAACSGEYTLNYTANAGGSIKGKVSQTVKKGKDGTEVTAIPDSGYRFKQWSDGLKTVSRTDKNVDGNRTFAASFELIPDFDGGSGTLAHPYKIAGAAQLKNIDKFPDAFYELSADITLPVAESGECNFSPLCSEQTPFNGYFDGKNHEIRNLTIQTDYAYAGLFTYIGEDGTVKNLKLTNVSISAPEYAGTTAGYSEGEIINVTASGTMTYTSGDSEIYFGGIAGGSLNKITDCSSTVSIAVSNAGNQVCAGGIAGFSFSEIKKCYAAVDITVSALKIPTIGGIAGYVYYSSVSESRSSGSIDIVCAAGSYSGGIAGGMSQHGSIEKNCAATDINVNSSKGSVYSGGLIGYCDSTGGLSLSGCYVSGNINVISSSIIEYDSIYAGGLIGWGDAYYGISVANCYATGDVNVYADNITAFSGGIAGYVPAGMLGSSSATACYATGKITSSADEFTGGLFGYFEGTLTNCHWLYYADGSAGYAVGFSNTDGNPSDTGSVKYSSLGNMYNLASTLGMEAWKNADGRTPKLSWES